MAHRMTAVTLSVVLGVAGVAAADHVAAGKAKGGGKSGPAAVAPAPGATISAPLTAAIGVGFTVAGGGLLPGSAWVRVITPGSQGLVGVAVAADGSFSLPWTHWSAETVTFSVEQGSTASGPAAVTVG